MPVDVAAGVCRPVGRRRVAVMAGAGVLVFPRAHDMQAALAVLAAHAAGDEQVGRDWIRVRRLAQPVQLRADLALCRRLDREPLVERRPERLELADVEHRELVGQAARPLVARAAGVGSGCDKLLPGCKEFDDAALDAQGALGHLPRQREREQEPAAVGACALGEIKPLRERPVVNEQADRLGQRLVGHVHVDRAHQPGLDTDAIVRLARPARGIGVGALLLGPLRDAADLALAVVAAGGLAQVPHFRLGADLGLRVRHHRQQVGGQPQHQGEMVPLGRRGAEARGCCLRRHQVVFFRLLLFNYYNRSEPAFAAQVARANPIGVALRKLARSAPGAALWIRSSGGGNSSSRYGAGMMNPPPDQSHVSFV